MATNNKLPRVVVDSCVLICRLTGKETKYEDGITSLFHEVDSNQVELFGSMLLLTEVYGGGFKEAPDLAKENRVLTALNNPNLITLAQVTRQVATIARDLRRTYNKLKSADSVHLATAIAVEAGYFVTIDEDDFPIGQRVQGTLVMLPDSVLGTPVLPPDR